MMDQNARYEDFQVGANSTGENSSINLVEPITPRALNVAAPSMAGDVPDTGPI